MVGPGDEISAGAHDYGRLRASNADREQIVAQLKAAFVQGRLTKEEFDARVGQTFASRTYAELAAVTVDLPAGLSVTQSRPIVRADGWLTMKRAVISGACIVIPTVITGLVGLAISNGLVVLVSLVAFIMATVAAGTVISEAWDKKKSSRGRRPQRHIEQASPHTCDNAPRHLPGSGIAQMAVA